MTSVLDTTNPELLISSPLTSPRATIEPEFPQHESQDPQEEVFIIFDMLFYSFLGSNSSTR